MRSDLALAALASAAVPGMKPVAVAGVVRTDDPDHQQAVVEDATGRRWLVRSPLTPVAGARLRRGDELVRQLSRHVPFKVPAPVGYASVGQDGHAVVYPHVEGFPLDLTHLPAGTGLASAVGRTVAAIHNIPRGVFEEQDVPVFDSAGCRQRLIADVDRAAETGRVPTGLLARWEEAFDAAPLWQFATVPVHGAFRGATVLVAFGDEDAASGRVVAVTDWEDAMVADPAIDLAELYANASPAAWESVLDAYALARAQRPDAYLHARARLVAETSRLRGLARAVTEQDEHLSRRIVESLRRMDRLTEDDDSLVPVTARGAGSVRGARPSAGLPDAGVVDGPVPQGDAPGSPCTKVGSPAGRVTGRPSRLIVSEPPRTRGLSRLAGAPPRGPTVPRWRWTRTGRPRCPWSVP
ncbi:phosphotransferase [Ornithinimicrobium flavum]|uniref:phosphotransferase n=1 Tax=Ornithinimicrobium flavum TaxID=1288636 RepID=UPI001EE88BA5|nr:phosphotransferase [Ornithinimicrobium flavum]